MLVRRGLHLLLLMLTNCWLSLTSQTLSVPQHLSLPVLISNIQLADWRGNGKGRAHTTNLSSEKVLSWQVIGLENRV